MRISFVIITLMLASQIAIAQKKQTQKDPIIIADSLFTAGDFKAAIPHYEAGLKKVQNPPNAQPWFRLGYSYHRLNEEEMAIGPFRKAEAINPQFPGLRVNMAKSYSMLGNISMSVAALDSAVRTGFGNYKLLDSDRHFENLRKSDQYAGLRSRVYNMACPCENLPAARDFDFWLGEWDVYPTANPGVKAGYNRISRRSSGCVILEEWESAGPHNGVSINYFDPATGKWNQKWAGSGQDIVEFYDGSYADGTMRFKFDSPAPAGGVAPTGRLTFTNLGPDKVRQHSEQSSDGGKTWMTLYDFTYIKRKS
jgi:tetratricopeptide (TPR) repeat protein